MSDKVKKWKLWYPEEIFLKKSKKNKNYFWNISHLKEQDFCNNINKSYDLVKKNDDLKELKKEIYNYGFQDGFKKSEEKNDTLLRHKLNKLLSNINTASILFEKMLFKRLLKTILIISSYIIGKNLEINESLLLKQVKKIIDKDTFFLKKKQLIIHPNNKKILEKILQNSICKDNWELCYDGKIDINGFKIRSENGDIDNTIDARWKELCRLVSEECE